jgi:hypothetical protein
MAKGLVLDAASARAIDGMFTRVYGPAASQIQKRTGSPWRGNMVVRLTEEADPITEDADTIPYKATLVYLDSTNGNYVDIDFVFDPDKNTEDPGVAAYVYESNGKTGLVGKFVIITFRGAPGTGGSWVFDHSEAEPELARINTEVAPGKYTGWQLDDDLVATGILYNGAANELPLLESLSGRQKIEQNEVVQVLRRGEKAYFEWNDPAMRNAGDDGSPPDGGNGSFDPFAEDGGAVGGILKNFNPDDGHYLFNRLWAKGSEGSGSEATLGLAIKPVSAYNWELSIVGEDGNPYIPPPVDPEDEVTCEYSMFFNRASRELVLIQTTDDLVEHECARVHIPCCDENGEEGYDPDTPPEDPDSPTDDPYDDGCTEPTISLTPYEGICSPPAIAQKIADINIQLNGNNFRDVTIDVSANATFKGAAINNPFAISANKKYIAWVGGAGVNGDVGDYSFDIIVSVTGCTSNWSTAYVVTIKDCNDECDSPEEVTGGDGGGDTCDESTAVVTLTDQGKIPIVGTEPAERAVVTVTMNLDHGRITLPSAGPLIRFEERTGEGSPRQFAYNSSISYTMLVPDSTDTKRETVSVQSTRVATQGASRSTSPPLGSLNISYNGGTIKSAYCIYRNGAEYSPRGEATDGSPARSGTRYSNGWSKANGNIDISLDLITSSTDPSPDREVGKLGVDNPCTNRRYTYAINGGAQAANFMIVGDSLYLKPTADSSLIGIGTWEVTIDASHSIAPPVSKTFNISAQDEADAVAIDNDIARGGQNEAIASITPLNGSTPVGGPMDYQVVSYRDGNATDQQLFYIESSENGEATLRANVNLPAGAYQVRVGAQNQTMNAGGTFVQQDIGIIIDKGAGQYIKPQLIGVV